MNGISLEGLPVWAVVLLVLFGLGGGAGILKLLIESKTTTNRRQSDELTEFRKELRQELKDTDRECDRKLEEASEKIKAIQKAHDEQREIVAKLKDDVASIRMDFAQYRAAVRTMIMQMKQGDPSWKHLAEVLMNADHDVDKMIIGHNGHEVEVIRVKRILVVDDFRDAVQALRLHLGSCGYDVTVTESGPEAIAAARLAFANGKPFDLILLDEAMEPMAGHDVAKNLRLTMETPIAFLTANPHATELEPPQLAEIGNCAIWPKPMDYEFMQSEIKRVMDHGFSTAAQAAPVRNPRVMV